MNVDARLPEITIEQLQQCRDTSRYSQLNRLSYMVGIIVLVLIPLL